MFFREECFKMGLIISEANMNSQKVVSLVKMTGNLPYVSSSLKCKTWCTLKKITSKVN